MAAAQKLSIPQVIKALCLYQRRLAVITSSSLASLFHRGPLGWVLLFTLLFPSTLGWE